MIRDISSLDKEEKLIEIALDMSTKQSMGEIIGSHIPLYVPEDKIKGLLEDIIDDIKYISDSPRFEIDFFESGKNMNKTINSFSSFVESKEDIVDLFKDSSLKVFVFYNLLRDSSTSNKYILRGAFVDDIQKVRNNRINEILK